MNIRPPDVLSSWDELERKNDIVALAHILAYNQIREHEEAEAKQEEMKVLMSVIIGKAIV